MKKFQVLLFLVCLTGSSMCVNAQKEKRRFSKNADTLAAIKMFARVCNNYKGLPLQVEMEFQTSTNIITSKEDTASMHGSFFLTESGSYSRVGNVEQISNDSMLAVISHGTEQIFLYQQYQSVQDRLTLFSNLWAKDSLYKGLGKKFVTAITTGVGEVDTIQCKSRSLLPLTSLPIEIIELLYDRASLYPVTITSRKNTLQEISSDQYSLLLLDPVYKDLIFHAEKDEYFILNEIITSSRFNKIQHEKLDRLPVTINDKFMKSIDGKFVPIGEISSYVMNTDF